MELTGKQRRALRAIGHHLDAIVQVGKEGITPALTKAVEQALDDHELIKVKVGESSPIDRHEAAEALAEATGSQVAQVLGRTLLLFRRHPEEPKIALPGMPLPPKTEKTEKTADADKPAPRRAAPRSRGPQERSKPAVRTTRRRRDRGE